MDETAAPAQTRWEQWGVRVLRFPLTRIVLFVAGIAAAVVLQGLAAAGLSLWLEISWLRVAVGVVFPILAVHFAYRGMTRLLERRSAAELSLSGALRETSAGALVGAACLTLIVALIAALGFYQVQGARQPGAAPVDRVRHRRRVKAIAEEVASFSRCGVPDSRRGARNMAGPHHGCGSALTDSYT